MATSGAAVVSQKYGTKPKRLHIENSYGDCLITVYRNNDSSFSVASMGKSISMSKDYATELRDALNILLEE